MWLPVRRVLAIMLCIVALVFAVFSIVGDVTGNDGLWTLGGKVGMARGTIACVICLAVALILVAVNGNGGGPFQPVP